MKLYPLSQASRTATNINNISRRLGIDVLTFEPVTLNGIVILADGTPDDCAIAVIAYHLNGKKSVGVVKPEEKRYDVFRYLPVYLKYKVDKIAVLIDQENEGLASVFNKIEKKVSETGIVIQNAAKERRLKVYRCRHGVKEFQLISIVNGLDEHPFERHTIEDHLLKVAEKLPEVKISSNDPKKVWNELKDRQYEVYKKLKETKDIEDVFPQQVKGLKCLCE
ncbi:MAG: hypothetical protein B9J98_00185 [Candidatus Terraquivivens tikiterensis]|uniref:Uncharacterized protein n=1 Tax=Candidatus Terraquivivens tikiterensis TaxID=1980982 RepID=A0A2R7Y9V9_9ARCH|nr:MAG: hypothetical protein B9J98_00185 [Candidatus Terraquivivens tikiterensis]